MFVFESCLFLLALAKLVQVTVSKREQTPDLMIVLIYDSIVYFGGVLSLIVANLVIWEGARVSCHLLLVLPRSHLLLQRSLFESLLGYAPIQNF